MALTDRNFYKGMITPAEDTIFVFGSNLEGRHGAGAAKVARERFGAEYGVSTGITGQAYALPTKDLRVTENKGLRSLSAEQITNSIRELYSVARNTPEKQFKIAYTNGPDESTLNGYSGREMIAMFVGADGGRIPGNVIFSELWKDEMEKQLSDLSQALDAADEVEMKLSGKRYDELKSEFSHFWDDNLKVTTAFEGFYDNMVEAFKETQGQNFGQEGYAEAERFVAEMENDLELMDYLTRSLNYSAAKRSATRVMEMDIPSSGNGKGLALSSISGLRRKNGVNYIEQTEFLKNSIPVYSLFIASSKNHPLFSEKTCKGIVIPNVTETEQIAILVSNLRDFFSRANLQQDRIYEVLDVQSDINGITRGDVMRAVQMAVYGSYALIPQNVFFPKEWAVTSLGNIKFKEEDRKLSIIQCQRNISPEERNSKLTEMTISFSHGGSMSGCVIDPYSLSPSEAAAKVIDYAKKNVSKQPYGLRLNLFASSKTKEEMEKLGVSSDDANRYMARFFKEVQKQSPGFTFFVRSLGRPGMEEAAVIGAYTLPSIRCFVYSDNPNMRIKEEATLFDSRKDFRIKERVINLNRGIMETESQYNARIARERELARQQKREFIAQSDRPLLGGKKEEKSQQTSRTQGESIQRKVADKIKEVSVDISSLKMPNITESAWGYQGRTRENANHPDVDFTLAFAVDFNTYGEIATAKCAGESLVKIQLEGGHFGKKEVSAAVKHIVEEMPLEYINNLESGWNIAGNGIYTLAKHGITQEEVNHFVSEVVNGMKEAGIKVATIRSGGQTGADIAGIYAAMQNDIPSTCHMPKGYHYRDQNNIEHAGSKEEIQQMFMTYAKEISEEKMYQIEGLFPGEHEDRSSFVNPEVQSEQVNKFEGHQVEYGTEI